MLEHPDASPTTLEARFRHDVRQQKQRSPAADKTAGSGQAFSQASVTRSTFSGPHTAIWRRVPFALLRLSASARPRAQQQPPRRRPSAHADHDRVLDTGYCSVVRFSDVSTEQIEGLRARIEEYNRPPAVFAATRPEGASQQRTGPAVHAPVFATAEDVDAERAGVCGAMDAGRAPGARATWTCCPRIKLGVERRPDARLGGARRAHAGDVASPICLRASRRPALQRSSASSNTPTARAAAGRAHRLC